MKKRILEILDNVRYWDTCPNDYKKDINDFLESQNQELNPTLNSFQKKNIIK